MFFDVRSLFFKHFFNVRWKIQQKVLRFHGKKAEDAMDTDEKMNKIDLGGVGEGHNGWKTVNLLPGCDVQRNILDIDDYCRDGTVDIFKMVHTFEHLPAVELGSFMGKLLNKLKKGGKLIVIQTDIKKVLELYKNGEIDFYCLRDIVFSPIDRRKNIYKTTGMDLLVHQSMWGADELKSELLCYGFPKVNIFDAGCWDFDVESVFPFQKNEAFFGVKIPNMGVEAIK